MNRKYVPIILIAIAVVIAIISALVLPERVVVQFNGQGETRDVSRYSAMATPFVISVLGAFLYLRDIEKKDVNRFIGISVIGYFVAAAEIVINLWILK